MIKLLNNNILDYIKWRGDLKFKEYKINEVDSLILARISYLPLEYLINENEIITISELEQRFKSSQNINVLWEEDLKLLTLMSKSQRFGDLRLSNLLYIWKKETEEQFLSITILIDEKTICVSFRGTDCTLLGWKEDFNLSYKKHIGSHILAKEYLNNIGNIYQNKDIILCGHSKGGNIAVYSAAFVNKDIQNKILKIYNIEGPGFDEQIVNSEEYNKISYKINTYIPQDSIIGRLMNHKEKIHIVESNEKGFMQHDIYSWNVLGSEIIRRNECTNESNFIDRTLTEMFNEVEPEKRKIIVETIFQILFSTGADSFKELKSKKIENTKTILTSINGLDSETKNTIKVVIITLLKIAKNNLSELF